MMEASLTMISLGPVMVQVKAVSLILGTSPTNTNDAAILIVKVPIMNVLLSFPT